MGHKHYKREGYKFILASLGVTGMLTGCVGNTGSADSGKQSKETYVPEIVGTYEAEDASFSGNVTSSGERGGYSGNGYATGFQNDGDSCTFSVTIEQEGFYDLNFITASSDYKENYITVDGESLGTIVTDQKEFNDSMISRVYLATGSHEVTVSKYWGYIDLDQLIVQTSEPIDPSFYDVSAELINPNATENTKRLMSYLVDNYGTNILSGQYSQDGMNGREFAVIKKETGKTPAVLGLDLIEYSPSRVVNGSKSMATQAAIGYWKQGGIVTFCWHWNAPEKYLTGNWYSGFYNDSTNIDLAKIMNGEDPEGYDLLMEDIDAIAQQLLILQDEGVPILWRPLHEASGGWFWWGASGPEAYKQLYILLYDKLTNEYGLNNLIWVWNGQDAEWYPGEHVYTSQVNKYLEAANYTSAKKMVVLSENGCVFDPELAKRDGAMWGFWCTWGSEFVAKDVMVYTYSDQYTEADKLKEFYENEIVITQDELPDLTSYPIREELQ
ncbi:MAG: beta-mannosidase [Lachnospiraceae bacterium]|nr:beta-mannosidase [Lachnospiraceae bacterium]